MRCPSMVGVADQAFRAITTVRCAALRTHKVKGHTLHGF